jgi:hypothetical protein
MSEITRDTISLAVEKCIKRYNWHTIKKEITESKRGYIHIKLITSEFSRMESSNRDFKFWRFMEDELDQKSIICITQCLLLLAEEDFD